MKTKTKWHYILSMCNNLVGHFVGVRFATCECMCVNACVCVCVYVCVCMCVFVFVCRCIHDYYIYVSDYYNVYA